MSSKFGIKKDPLYANPLKRLCAYLIDLCFITLAVLCITSFLGNYDVVFEITQAKVVLEDGVAVLSREIDHASQTKLLALSMFIETMYFSIFLCSKKQATIGNQIFRIMVVDNKLIKITPLVAISRSVANIINSQIYYIGFLIWFFRKDGALLNDIMSGTRVINIRK